MTDTKVTRAEKFVFDAEQFLTITYQFCASFTIFYTIINNTPSHKLKLPMLTPTANDLSSKVQCGLVGPFNMSMAAVCLRDININLFYSISI